MKLKRNLFINALNVAASKLNIISHILKSMKKIKKNIKFKISKYLQRRYSTRLTETGQKKVIYRSIDL